MASWTPRLPSSNSRNDSIPTLRSMATPLPTAAPRRGLSRLTEADILDHAADIPSLHASLDTQALSNIATKRAKSPFRHGRSMSHPFPSLFQSKKKRQGDNSTVAHDSTDEDQVSSKAPSSKPARVSDNNLMSGKCVTCDSMVRWPKELALFRCTICMTINDLRPRVMEVNNGKIKEPQASIGARIDSHAGSFSRVTPLSNKKTSALIEKCLVSYLMDSRSIVIEHLKGTPLSLPMQGNDTSSRRRRVSQSQYILTSQKPRAPITTANSEKDLAGRGEPLDQNYVDRTLDGHPSRSTPTSYETRVPDQSGLTTHQHIGAHSGVSLSPPRLTNNDSVDKNDSTIQQRRSNEKAKSIFRPLEEYIITSFLSRECVNKSFATLRPDVTSRAATEGNRPTMTSTPEAQHDTFDDTPSTMDAKTLLIGDIAENRSWWTGGRNQARLSDRSKSYHTDITSDILSPPSVSVNLKSPRIDWAELDDWYRMVLYPGNNWRRHLNEVINNHSDSPAHWQPSVQELKNIEDRILEAQAHTQRVLLKATESLLKRPGAPLNEPDDVRFLLILLANPLLYSSPTSHLGSQLKARLMSQEQPQSIPGSNREHSKEDGVFSFPAYSHRGDNSPGHHSGIIKRILGLLSNLPNECHHHLVSWFSRLSESHFRKTTELVSSFVTYRLTRQQGRNHSMRHDPIAGLVPSVTASGRSTSAALHAALGTTSHSSKQSDTKSKTVIYSDDWQIKAAARVMALLFSANNSGIPKKSDLNLSTSADNVQSIGLAFGDRPRRPGQILSTSDFYNTLLDYSDLVADYEAWEARRGKFAFCQYPFFLSIWAKIQIMEYDARRQMEVKAREAFFDSIMTRKTVNQHLVLRIRRDCLVEDSLKSVSEVVGSGGEEIKKGLRIEFKGEEGIDAGGLRKEWFLLLVRDVFNPEHGMFTYDEDSVFCYFNPNSFETSDQFFLVGVVLGLAIYNSTILDVALPPFAFRKLLAAGPTAAPGASSHAKPIMIYTLDDLAEFRPALAHGLRQLLDYDGDVEETFCRDFVADVERYGQLVQVPLCANGQSRAVTNSNRREFVDLYVRYLLDTAVTRQFEPFKRGFFTVCGGNALSLFRPEEIELLIRGSDESLDISSLRAVSVCENWGVSNAAESEPVIGWFWDSFEKADVKDQRKLLSFITGSDRIPAMGASNLVIKISCLGDDVTRFPVARTCFNMLSLRRYTSREQLEGMLWRAVMESEGFGLK